MRLIDGTALVEFLLKEIIECDEEYDEKSDHIILGARQEAELIRDKVKEMPTVDIVRCKDCKYLHTTFWKDTQICERHAYEIIMKPDDFCSRGERKDE